MNSNELPTLGQLAALDREARRMRSAVAGALLRRAYLWLAEMPMRLREQSIAQRIGQPTDVADLEHRLRQLERGQRPGYI
ncbi:MAG: hypothetical protein ABIU95_05870 [Burkholderiales bacterium]